MHDGSMSGEEYLRRAAELNERQAAVNRERALLQAHEQRMQTAGVIDRYFLAQHFRRAVHWRPQPATVVIDYVQASNGDPARWTANEQAYVDCDLVIKSVHNLPTRVPCVHPFLISHSITEPMRAQMESGKYPTLEEHYARSSVAYEPFINEMGQFVAKQLTREEEDAIRTRSDPRVQVE